MSLKSLLKRLPFFGGVSSVLVCETDGFHLHGAVIGRDADHLKVSLVAKSEASDYKAAVKELIANLREQGWQGKEAVLLTPAVFTALIELPISPSQPRNPMQMQELIRWELEPLLMQHATLWSAGQVLLALGYMTPAQVTDVLDRQQGKSKGAQADGSAVVYSFKRFCELALEMGYITQTQVDECLIKQSWLRSDSEDFACGWMPQGAVQDPKDSAGQPDVHPWLVSGANMGMMRQWEQAFATHRVVLSEVYPLVGCAAELIEPDAEVMLLESMYGVVAGLRMQSNKVTAIKLQHSGLITELDACLEIYHDIVTPDVQQVWLSASSAFSDDLVKVLGEMIGRHVSLLPALHPQVSAGMMGVASKLLKLGSSGNVASVSVQGAKAPLLQRVEVRAVAAGLVLFLLIGALEASLWVRAELAQNEHAKIAEAKKEFDAVLMAAQKKVDTVSKLKDEKKAQSDALEKLYARFDFFAAELPMRAQFVQTFLNDLNSSISEEVVINMIDETPNLGIRIAGWALTEKSAQQFIQTLKNTMARWDIDVVDPIVRSQAGRLGLLGYDVHFRLVNVKQAKEIAEINAAAAAKPTKNKKAK